MEIKQIPLSLVTPSPMNPRKTFDEGELQELADNIEKQGLLQPITVRPIKDPSKFGAVDGHAPQYEIVCGERRYRAFRILSAKWSGMDVVAPKGASYNRFTEISAIIREMTDREAKEAMITENLQRKNVDPIEEAASISELREMGYTSEEVALRIGKSIRYVIDRVKLNNLIPELMLEVREKRMSLSAAMIIAKLDDEHQRQFRSQYSYMENLTKATAESFVLNLFLSIDNSIWAKSDKDFAGGCGRKCSECINNTANHGCLFWEMNNKKGGKCTNRKAHWSKTLAFILEQIDANADQLVKKGQPLEYGKTVLCINENYGRTGEEFETNREQLKAAIAVRELLVVDPNLAFKGRCFYDLDDERTKESLKNGEAYRCISLYNYANPAFEREVWYTNKSNGVVEKDGTPYEVKNLLSQLDYENNTLPSKLQLAETDALYKCTPSKGALTDHEKVLLLTFMVSDDLLLGYKLGMSACYSDEEKFKYVAAHPEIWNQIFRGWMYSMIHTDDGCRHLSKPFLDEFGAAQCPEEYQKAKDKVLDKHKKDIAKLENKLAKLGYDTDGKPLQKEEDKSLSAQKQFEEMKKKHPDAIMLFRVGDFYECYEEDAVKASNTLGLVLTERGCTKLAGFPHHSLDTYLPKLIQSGHRVAICEQDKKTNQ